MNSESKNALEEMFRNPSGRRGAKENHRERGKNGPVFTRVSAAKGGEEIG